MNDNFSPARPPSISSPKRTYGNNRQNQRGSAILIVMLLIATITILGAAVMGDVAVEFDAAGTERASESAAHIAQAGLDWAITDLSGRLGVFDYITTTLALTVTTYCTPLGCPTCTVVGCNNGVTTPTWYTMTPTAVTQGSVTGGGNFLIFVAADPAQPTTHLIVRSIGTLGGAYGAAQTFSRQFEAVISGDPTP